MKERATRFQVRARAARLGLEVNTHRPGAHYHYTFTDKSGAAKTVVGTAQAEQFLLGYGFGKAGAQIPEDEVKIKILLIFAANYGAAYNHAREQNWPSHKFRVKIKGLNLDTHDAVVVDGYAKNEDVARALAIWQMMKETRSK